MADPQIRLSPTEAAAQMTTISGKFDGTAGQVTSTAGAGVDSRIAAAVNQQVQTSHEMITSASSTSDKSKSAADALGDQDKANRGKVEAVKADLSDKGRSGPGGPRLPQDGGGASGLSWKPGDKRRKPYVVDPGALGPPSYPQDPLLEVGPRSGIFVPQNELPGVKVLSPGALGPPMYPHDPYVELIPGSGVWAPQSDFPGAKFLNPAELGPSAQTSTGGPAFTEWLPGSGIWVPTGQLRP
ncbi:MULTISPECIES: hypothetical protein [Mycolicibacter]|uniref:Uncharacterized protein n=2 Tax=Mycolicibacter TaxID=1073531 RepID=A0ABU5XNT4_9MYCO|nr:MULTISPECIES: hypothetical protein [unclassified Mycolicibacter]MEB3023427.1 hypothetical protein [Mycolicibacter sp. MYC098]MEB3033769.1 hypothetical protein [Mycolicibacter sp. MYC340]